MDTVFDHALICLKLYELTENRTYLQKGIEYIKNNERNGKWHFSRHVKDIPKDADTTAFALLYLTMYGEDIDLSIFDELMTKEGGCRTYFGNKDNDLPDPIVNTAVAFLYILRNCKNRTYRPRNTIELAQICTAAKYRNLIRREKTLASQLLQKNIWTFSPLYTQNSPKFLYGNNLLTYLFALEAICSKKKILTVVQG